MVRDFDITPFFQWLPEAVLHYLAVLGLLALTGLVISFVVAAVRYGPLPAGDRIYKLLAAAGVDLVRISPRRVFALARLAVQESIRRRVWVVLVVFGMILLFAGWFLVPTNDPNRLSSFDPGKLYLNFVLTATSFLAMALALFLSAFSLPADLKSRTIYTVVTKPVRTGEIVLGRMLGFTFIGSILLAIMAAAGYVFVERTLNHTHDLTAADLHDLPLESGSLTSGGKEGFTSLAHNHRHHVVLDADGNGTTDMVAGHVHHVHAETVNGQTRYIVGPPAEQLVARVPIYGKLRFLDRTGKQGAGINIGKEWEYRKYLDGGAPMAAIWTFTNVTPERFPDGKLPLEMLLRVFRTYKGEIADEKRNNRTVGILGSIQLQNPEQPSMKSTAIIFTVKDQVLDRHVLDGHKLEREVDGRLEAMDLFDNLTTKDGRLEVVLRCLSPSQYIGVAEADLYLQAPNSSYTLNFCKGYFGIWLQMLLVIGYGVMFSTFLSGPVAMVLTMVVIALGFFTENVTKLFEAVITGNDKIVPGGGPVESLIRIVTQTNITLHLEPTLGIQAAQLVDKIWMSLMWAVVNVLPNFADYDNVRFVADGFDVPAARIAQEAVRALGFFVALFLGGHLFLRMREIAK